MKVRVCSIADRHAEYAKEVLAELKKAGIRATADTRNEKVNAKIREAQLAKIPVMLVIGDREAEQRAVAVRHRKGGDQGSVALADFVQEAKNQIASYNQEP